TLPYLFGVSYLEVVDEWWVDVMALFWSFHYLSNTTPPFYIGIQLSLIYSFMLFGWLKLYYIHQTYKCYRGRVTKKRATMVGIASELQLLVWYGLAILGSIGSPSFSGVFILTPIPLLLLCGLLILYVKPPPVTDYRKPRTKLLAFPFPKRRAS
ncbi:MAG: hypothetical protein ACXABY_30475, partial [Candidatus Thorarchaeota archaeon]